MYLYYITIIFVSLPGLLLQKKTDNGYRTLYSLYAFTILWLFSSLRGYTVGGDLLNYIPLFNEIAKDSVWDMFTSYNKYGILFKLYIKGWSYISADTTFILAVTSLFNIGVVCWFINKRSYVLWLSFFLYITLGYYTNTFNSVRSSMALALGIIGIDALMDKKKLKAFIWFILAIEVHKTIIPILFLFLLKEKRYNLSLMIISVSLSFVLFNSLGSSHLANLILLYDTGYASITEFEGKGYNLLILDILITFGCYYLCKKKSTPQKDMLVNILWTATCLQCLAPIFSIATRISFFFTFYGVVLIPNSISDAFSEKSKRLVVSALSILCLIYFKITIMTPTATTNTNTQATIPYYFYWEKK